MPPTIMYRERIRVDGPWPLADDARASCLSSGNYRRGKPPAIFCGECSARAFSCAHPANTQKKILLAISPTFPPISDHQKGRCRSLPVPVLGYFCDCPEARLLRSHTVRKMVVIRPVL